MDGMSILCDAISAQPDSQSTSTTEHSITVPINGSRTAKLGRRRQRQEGLEQPGAGRPHQCRICNRTYERVDHLSRHLRSHENARPFKCSYCPKRFNRQDLLNRHAAAHERDDGGTGPPRPMIRRTERAASACAACATAKVKCENEKPCRRCQSKNIACQPSVDLIDGPGSIFFVNRDNMSQGSGESIASPSESGRSKTLIERPGSLNANESLETNTVDGDQMFREEGQVRSSSTGHPMYNDSFPLPTESFQPSNSNQSLTGAMQYGTINPQQFLQEDLMDDIMFFPNVPGFNQDVDIGFWDFPLDGFQIPYSNGEFNYQPESETGRSHSISRPSRDIARGYAAFKRSPWLWTPAPKDRALSDQSDLTIHEDQLEAGLSPSSIAGHKSFDHINLDYLARDRMLTLVVSTNRDGKAVPGFPHLDLLNQLLQNYFVRESYLHTSWIHIPSFDPTKCPPHLLIALVSAGSTLVSVPTIWKLGLALQEIARVTIAELVSSSLLAIYTSLELAVDRCSTKARIVIPVTSKSHKALHCGWKWDCGAASSEGWKSQRALRFHYLRCVPFVPTPCVVQLARPHT
jgi:hypothetical protein